MACLNVDFKDKRSLSQVMNEEFRINLRMRCHNYICLLAVQCLTDVWFIFLTVWFQAHKSVAYLEIILPWIIILFRGNMGTRQYFPLLQVLVILLCFGKKQPYFPTAIFISLARLWTNVIQESKDGLLLHSILRVSILQFSLCFLFYFSCQIRKIICCWLCVLICKKASY